MNRRIKLELTWVGKEKRPRLEPRILLEDAALSYHASHRRADDDLFDNRLIYGDNLPALKALEQEFAGKVKCVYIDPPFNTGQAFEHYDDGLEHSLWLHLMYSRLKLLHRLLSPEGTIFVHIDVEENHYLKVMMDEIFERRNFLGQVAYERSGVCGIGQGGAFLVNTHEQILCYAKDKSAFEVGDNKGESPLERKDMKRYSKILVSTGGRKEVARFVAPATGRPVVIYKHAGEEIRTISLRGFEQRRGEILRQYVDNFGRVFRTTSVQAENEFQNRILSHCGPGLYSADYLVSRGKREGEFLTAYYLNQGMFAWLADTAEVRGDRIVRINRLSDFWTHADVPKADLANEGGVDFRRGKKPEALLHRIIQLSTRPGDLVLDSFAGSGTTGAVAHKMGRRFIMIELGEHCHSHIIPRLRRVVDGADPSGVTSNVGWKGGGGFRYFRLAPPLLEKDKWGNRVVDRQYNAAMLAEAVCRHEGFAYAPSDTVYWRHGHSTGRDFIYVTTQNLSRDQLAALSEEVGDGRSLLVCCAAFRARPEDFPNLTLKKIPNPVLDRCEWGRDDYSLQIAGLPRAGDDGPAGPPEGGARRAPAGRVKAAGAPLFEQGGEP